MLQEQLGNFNRTEEQILKNLGIGDSCGACVVDAVKKIMENRNLLDSKSAKTES